MTHIPHDLVRYCVLFAVAFGAGAMNSVAGGGTLLTFPTLILAGVSPIVANATNTLALVPGSASAMWGYRKEIVGARTEMLLLGGPSLLGGVIGALWVIHTGNREFAVLVPWLILGATGLFIVQEPITRLVRRSESRPAGDVPPDMMHRVGIAVFQFFVAIYGGFFGAGMGIAMLAALGVMGFARNIHRANGIKNFAAVCINGVAAVTFIAERKIDWSYAGLMAIAAILGGYGGAGVARRMGQRAVRASVIVIGIAIGIVMLARQYQGL